MPRSVIARTSEINEVSNALTLPWLYGMNAFAFTFAFKISRSQNSYNSPELSLHIHKRSVSLKAVL